MFDQMTFTKAFAAICGAFLIFLFANWGADALYTVGVKHHGDEEVKQAFVIETGASTDNAAGGAATDAVPFDQVYAAADPAAGEKVFAKCKACHKIDGANATGPHLNGVVERAVASVDGFAYSEPMKAHGGEWTPERLDEFLLNPKGDVPGTKMAFAGLPKPTDRANVIAYLNTLPQ